MPKERAKEEGSRINQHINSGTNLQRSHTNRIWAMKAQRWIVPGVGLFCWIGVDTEQSLMALYSQCRYLYSEVNHLTSLLPINNYNMLVRSWFQKVNRKQCRLIGDEGNGPASLFDNFKIRIGDVPCELENYEISVKIECRYAGLSLFLLFKAIKHQIEKNMVDAR